VTLRQQIKDKHSFGATLALIVISTIVIAVPVEKDIGVLLRVLAGGAVVWSVLVASQASRRTVSLAIALFVTALVLTTAGIVRDSWNLSGFADCCLAALTALMIVAIIRNLSTHLRVSLRTVAGALCVYLLIGIFFAGVYAAMSGFGWQALSVHPLYYKDAIYFSYITQLTIGYGDIVPHTPWGRVIGSLVIVFGVTFIAFLTATVTSLFVSAEQGEQHAEDREQRAESQELLRKLERRLAAIEAKLDRAP
jgi:hypothetical protein